MFSKKKKLHTTFEYANLRLNLKFRYFTFLNMYLKKNRFGSLAKYLRFLNSCINTEANKKEMLNVHLILLPLKLA